VLNYIRTTFDVASATQLISTSLLVRDYTIVLLSKLLLEHSTHRVIFSFLGILYLVIIFKRFSETRLAVDLSTYLTLFILRQITEIDSIRSGDSQRLGSSPRLSPPSQSVLALQVYLLF